MKEITCKVCKYRDNSISQEPCKSCGGHSNWEEGNQGIINLLAENKRLKEEAQSAISFAAKTEIDSLRAQLTERTNKYYGFKENLKPQLRLVTK